MIIALKTLHYLAFCLGIGGGTANLMAARLQSGTGDEGKASLGALRRQLAFASGLAIVLLWLTGIGLVISLRPEIGAWPILFWVKLLVAVALTAVIGKVQYLILGAKRLGPPDPATLKKLVHAAVGLATLALILAIAAFT